MDGLHHPSQLYSSHLLSVAVAVYCQRQEHFFIEGVASKSLYWPKFDVQFVKCNIAVVADNIHSARLYPVRLYYRKLCLES